MRKFFRALFASILLLIVCFSAYALISGKTYLFKAVYYNFAGIDDYKIFTNDTVRTAAAQPWKIALQPGLKTPDTLASMLADLSTVALLVVKNREVIYEKYDDGYSDTSLSNSFSVAKSITSLLVGAAIRDGLIRSENDLVGNYLPEFSTGLAAQLRIRDLLTMSSGSDWDESYANPFSATTQAYYGSDLRKTASSVTIKKQPGTYFTYKSGDTELLGLVLEKATGRSLASYAAEKLWRPLGAERPALWSTDRTGGSAKAYCCFNTNARDFARIGQLMLDSGRWNGTSIIDPAYFTASVTPCMIPDETGTPANYYGYQWWIRPGYPGVFYARGIMGQYIIMIPSRQIVLVRLGHKRSSKKIDGAPAEVDALINWGMTL
ncbi:MAG: class C beta-lactamase-related serine hydrolase [Chitinophagaceae bacterium]|nr:MAG: class C beta-lactamase-related serine hydrolase [Chitinophagaceae bacterium]